MQHFAFKEVSKPKENVIAMFYRTYIFIGLRFFFFFPRERVHFRTE